MYEMQFRELLYIDQIQIVQKLSGPNTLTYLN